MSLSILLVDDEEGICTVLGISLADRGYDVHTAGDARQALEIFDRIQAPIVLTDIKMPGMDGIDLLKALKQRNPDTEVIMITGHGDLGLAIKSLKHEAIDFITKPIDEEILDIALKRAVERITMRDQLRAYTENLEQLVAEKTDQLVQAERLTAMGETVAGLAHAIKNIAGGLRGGAFVVEKGLSLDNARYLEEGWQMVRGNVERIQQLSLDLLNIAKPDVAAFQSVDPCIPLREVYQLMRPRAAQHGIQLQYDCQEGLDPVDMDPEGIHRSLLNLVSNAIDACVQREARDTDRGAAVEVGVQRWAQGVEYTIRDNGVGMEAALKEKLFKGFVTTKGSRGTGIGLMLVRKIVEAHHGVIDVRSEPGRGSRFSLRFPGSRPV